MAWQQRNDSVLGYIYGHISIGYQIIQIPGSNADVLQDKQFSRCDPPDKIPS